MSNKQNLGITEALYNGS